MFSGVQRGEVIGVGLKYCRSTVAKFYPVRDVVKDCLDEGVVWKVDECCTPLGYREWGPGFRQIVCNLPGRGALGRQAHLCPFAPCTQIAGMPLEQVAPFVVVVEPLFQFPWLGRMIGSLWVRRALFLRRCLQRGGREKGTFPGLVIKRFTTETLLGIISLGQWHQVWSCTRSGREYRSAGPLL